MASSRLFRLAAQKIIPKLFSSLQRLLPVTPSMTTVDKTVAILSTVHGYVSDEAQCEALREHLRAISMVREIPFTIHEVAMRAVGTSGTAGTISITHIPR
jgi:hypothetical protein